MFSHLPQVLLLLPAQAPGGGAGCADPNMLLPVVMIAILYFLWIRPAGKERKQREDMLGQLKREDEVITSSGIIGTIKDMTEKVVTIEVARNTKIRVLRSAIAKTTAELNAQEAQGSDKSAEKASK